MFRPLIEDPEIAAAVSSLQQGWLGMGKSVGEFEAALGLAIGCDDRHVVAVSTGHAALHLAMMLAGIGPGDEVITPSFNNIADFQAILAVGATPVFCDIREDTLCVDVEKAERLIGPRTKAIIAMDYDCCLADHDAIADLAVRKGIRVIHDAAHSLGSKYNGRPVGSFSDIAMFSFDPVKTITCIDGGALVVQSQEDRDQLHEMRLIGMGQPSSIMYSNRRAWTYDVKRLGFRYHMANLHAAIGLSQLKRMPEISSSRQRACCLYSSLLSDIRQVRTPRSDFANVTPFLYYIQVPADHRQPLRDHLSSRGIDTGIHWQPGHWFSLLTSCPRGNLDVTEAVGRQILSLPLHSMMQDDDVRAVAESVRDYFGRATDA